MPPVRARLHARAARWRPDGVFRRRLRGLLQLQPPARHSQRMTRFRDACIEMAHGAGGMASRRLIEGLVAPVVGLAAGAGLEDAAIVPFGDVRLAFTADGFVVRPLRFSGGSIGELAVNGTTND